MKQSEPEMTEERRVALPLTEEEADILMNVLLSAPPCGEVSEGLTDRLLCRVAGVQRVFSRLCREQGYGKVRLARVRLSARPLRRISRKKQHRA